LALSVTPLETRKSQDLIPIRSLANLSAQEIRHCPRDEPQRAQQLWRRKQNRNNGGQQNEIEARAKNHAKAPPEELVQLASKRNSPQGEEHGKSRM
jgi:hypothetical protein